MTLLEPSKVHQVSLGRRLPRWVLVGVVVHRDGIFLGGRPPTHLREEREGDVVSLQPIGD